VAHKVCFYATNLIFSTQVPILTGNPRDAAKVTLAYTPDCIWRNRDSFVQGHKDIEALLTSKWEREQHYRLRKELFAFTDTKIAVQFWYEYYLPAGALVPGDTQFRHTLGGKSGDAKIVKEGGQWFRCYGLEDWTFDVKDGGKMRKRMMSGNDIEIEEGDRWFKDGVDVDSVEISEKHW
jgi:uncharacterized protein